MRYIPVHLVHSEFWLKSSICNENAIFVYSSPYIPSYKVLSKRCFNSNEAFSLIKSKPLWHPLLFIPRFPFSFIANFLNWLFFWLKSLICNESAIHSFEKLVDNNEAFSLMKRQLLWHPLPFIPRLCFSFVMEFFNWLPF